MYKNDEAFEKERAEAIQLMEEQEFREELKLDYCDIQIILKVLRSSRWNPRSKD